MLKTKRDAVKNVNLKKYLKSIVNLLRRCVPYTSKSVSKITNALAEYIQYIGFYKLTK